MKEETSHVTDTDLPPLLDELAALQATPVLRGDYQLKLARQNYFTSKQDKVRKTRRFLVTQLWYVVFVLGGDPLLAAAERKA